MADVDTLYLTVAELGQQIRSRKLKSADLTRMYLDRIKALDPRLSAFVTVTENLALEEAGRADREIQGGRYRGPLHGIPYGAKDLLATRGIPTMWGSNIFKDQVFDYDATVITRLREAGAVLLGKLAMIELAGGTFYRTAAASHTGPSKNPWDLGRWTCGSSSGSGGAVAAALVPFAIGSETWGSIVCPSAFCGVSGLRPSYGRVSRHRAMANSWTLDKLGPMARSAEDCALVLEAMAGPDPADPTTRPDSWKFRAERGPFKIGVFGEGTGEIQKLMQDAIKTLSSRGHSVAPVTLPQLPYEAAISVIQRAEACSSFWPLIRDGRLEELQDEGMKVNLASGVTISAIEYIQANRLRNQIQQEIRKVFETVDVIIAPSIQFVASRLGDDLEKAFAEAADPLGALGNVAGLPGLSVPCGFSAGLPVGLLILGASGDEQTVLSVGMEFQRATDWHRRRPPIP